MFARKRTQVHDELCHNSENTLRISFRSEEFLLKMLIKVREA
jgi:hypothetical protein